MNRVIGEVPARSMIIVLVSVGVAALAVFAAQYVLTVESPLGPELQTVLVEDPVPAEVSAPVAEAAAAIDPSSLGFDVRLADNYRIATEVNAGSAAAIDPSSPDFDVRLADNYRIATEVNAGSATAIDPSSPDFDVRLADNYRIFTHAVAVSAAGLEFDVREADNYRIFTQE